MSYYRSSPRPSLTQRLAMRSFAWLVARAPRSRLAALLAAGLVLVTGSLLMVTARRQGPQTYEGKYRRLG